MIESRKWMMGKLTLESWNDPYLGVRTALFPDFPVNVVKNQFHKTILKSSPFLIRCYAYHPFYSNGRSMAVGFRKSDFPRASWRSSVTCWEMQIRLVAESGGYWWLRFAVDFRINHTRFNRSLPCFFEWFSKLWYLIDDILVFLKELLLTWALVSNYPV